MSLLDSKRDVRLLEIRDKLSFRLYHLSDDKFYRSPKKNYRMSSDFPWYLDEDSLNREQMKWYPHSFGHFKIQCILHNRSIFFGWRPNCQFQWKHFDPNIEFKRWKKDNKVFSRVHIFIFIRLASQVNNW